ncbi:hypothetical protein [Cognatiyoonia sp. IB215182]|uniref:DUF7716 domain-containing protein n=1 Tax=Cognatiyoonia sp. IB215182 TaxID=3097353 RepID=UPI002A12839D|nr:hypothetical protein [Cognatiyoonia sp. IB215182]MDX8354533.1 hypothetical protein [Cognatiyoonia sp. IB215182]
MIDTTLGDIMENLDRFSWKDWVFIQIEEKISSSSRCLVIDTNEAELGSDNFTPLAAERLGMKEFLSIQDLQGVLKYLAHYQTNASTAAKCAAATYYFEYDAFMPSEMLNRAGFAGGSNS